MEYFFLSPNEIIELDELILLMDCSDPCEILLALESLSHIWEID